MTEKKPEKLDKTERAVTGKPDETPARRGLLKKLAIGGTAAALLPTHWTRPIVELGVLPAHATTTNCNNCDVSIQNTEFTTTDTTAYVEIDAVSTADAACNSGDVFAQLIAGGSPVVGVGGVTNNPSESVPASCNGSVCVASVSLWAYTTDVPTDGGNVTIRFTWPGGCVADDSEFLD